MIDITQIFVGTATLVVAHAQTHLHTALSCIRPVVRAGAIRRTGGAKEPGRAALALGALRAHTVCATRLHARLHSSRSKERSVLHLWDIQ